MANVLHRAKRLNLDCFYDWRTQEIVKYTKSRLQFKITKVQIKNKKSKSKVRFGLPSSSQDQIFLPLHVTFLPKAHRYVHTPKNYFINASVKHSTLLYLFIQKRKKMFQTLICCSYCVYNINNCNFYFTIDVSTTNNSFIST